jgi:hypothetical protein
MFTALRCADALYQFMLEMKRILIPITIKAMIAEDTELMQELCSESVLHPNAQMRICAANA